MKQIKRWLTPFLVLLAGAMPAWAEERKKPELGPPQAFVAPSVQQFKLSSGIPVYFYHKPGLPLVSMQTWVFTGSAHDPDGHRGLADLTAGMMEEGAGGRDALALAEAFEVLGADFSVSSELHGIAVSLNVTTDQFDAAAAVYRDVLLNPDFPEAEIKRSKGSYVNSLIQRYDAVGSIGRAVFFNQLYGDRHPYGVLATKAWPEYRALTRKHLRAFHQDHFHAGNMAVVVAGAVERDALQTKLDALFLNLPTKKQPLKPALPALKDGKRRIVLVDKPGASQSYLGIGRMGVAVDREDYYAARVMNTILGGSFASRLNQNIREEHGYAYNAYSYLVDRPGVGPFLARSDVQSDATAKAVQEFFNEFARMQKDLTEADVARAKNYLTLGYPSSFARVDYISELYMALLGNHRPVTVPEQYTQAVNAVTLKDVRQVAKKVLNSKKMLVVVVGDRATVEAELKALKLGPVTVLTVEQALGDKPKAE